MAKHDILLFNTTSSGFETNLNSDVVRIKGDSTELLSIQNNSDVEQLGIGTSTQNFTFNAALTSSGNFSSSLASSASFGRVEAKLIGDASQMTDTPITAGTVSSSAQVATDVSGAFDSGFTHSGAISGSSTSTGSFGFVTAEQYEAGIDISGVTNKIPAGTVSGAAQIASEISGAFTSGFEFTGTISGSATSTASFGQFFVNKMIGGDGQFLTNISYTPSTFSSSAQIASEISGAFDEGFTYGGKLSANQRFTASFVGVSGSAFAYANHSATTMSISSTCGSDFDYRLEDEITAGEIKGTSFGNGSWSAGPNRILTAGFGAAAGTQNAYLSIGGYTPSGTDATEKFDGTSFAASATLTAADCANSAAGTQNAVVLFNGHADPDGSEIYNGATFSETANRINGKRNTGAAGTQNASIVFGGMGPSPTNNSPSVETENFDGNTFTALNDMNLPNAVMASAGTQNSAIAAFGYYATSPATQVITQLWNGTNWSAGANGILARRGLNGYGTQNHFIAAGGQAHICYAQTEEWNGTTWSEQSDLPTAKGASAISGGGLGSAAIFAGGFTPAGAQNTVELWNAGLSTTGSFGRLEIVTKFGSGIDATEVTVNIPTNTVSGSAQLATDISGSFTSGFTHSGEIKGNTGLVNGGVWSIAANGLNTIRDYGASAGSGGGTVDASNSALFFGGRVSPAYVTCTEEWNGTSWSETGDLIASKGLHAGFGTTEAAVAAGGDGGSGGTQVEHFGGSNWSEGADSPAPIGYVYGMSAGTQNAGLIMNVGTSNYGLASTEALEYDGEAWSEGGSSTSKHTRGAMGGTQNSAVLFGGQHNQNTGNTCTEEYDGSSWSTGGALNQQRSAFGGDGSSAANALAVGDAYAVTDSGVNYARCTEAYNGANWTVKGILPYKQAVGEYQGSSTKGLYFGGYHRFPNLNSPGALNPTTYIWDDETVVAMGNTGSFGRVDAADGFLTTTDVSGITNFLPENAVSGAAQLATDISGSFDEGFEFSGAFDTNQLFTASFVGVSGSEFAYVPDGGAGGELTMSISSTCGSDFDYRLQDEIIAGKIKSFNYSYDGFDYYGAWSAGPNRNTVQAGAASVGTQNAYLSAGGYKSPKDETEKYDGATWSISAELPESNCAMMGFGTQNAAAFAGGFGDYDGTKIYNGAAYSNAGTNMTHDRRVGGSAGTQNAGFIFGGTAPAPYPVIGTSENFDGHNWTESTALNTARQLMASAGTQNSAIAAGGSVSPPASVTCTELWNGTSWTEIADMNTGRMGGAGIGTQNHFIAGGGYVHPAFSALTEEWNGTSWSETNDLSTARGSFVGSQGGLGSAGIVAGGQIGSPNATAATEFWNVSNSTTGSFGLLDVDKYSASDISDITNTSDILPAGTVSGSSQMSASISGSFEKGFNFQNAISGSSISTGSAGKISANSYTISDIISITGSVSNLVPTDLVSSSAQLASDISGAFDEGFNFNGAFDTNQILSASFVGVSGSAFAYAPAGGYGGELTMSISSTCGSDFDYRLNYEITAGKLLARSIGSGTWSAGPNKIVAASGIGAAGTQNAYLAVGGYTSPSQQSEKYDGSSWAASATLITANCALAGFGTQNAMAIAGGNADTNGTELYNGAAWANGTDLPHVTAYAAAFGTQNAGVVAGGRSGADKDETVSFNGNAYSSLNAMITARGIGGSAGTQNSGIIAGGYSPSSPNSRNETEEWDGTNWTSVANIITTRRGGTGYGTQNHFLYVGGHNPGYCACTEEWNGSSWSEVNNTITTRAFGGGAGGALGTAAIHAGGYVHPAASNTVEFWNDNTSTGSFTHIFALDYPNVDATGFLNFPTSSGTLSSSLQAEVGEFVSGSFNQGFEFSSYISASGRSTGSLNNFVAETLTLDNFVGNFGINVIPNVEGLQFDTRQFMPASSSKQLTSCGSCDSIYASGDGLNRNFSQSLSQFTPEYSAGAQIAVGTDGLLNLTFQTSSFVATDARGIQPAAWSTAASLITAAYGPGVGHTNAALNISGQTYTYGATTNHTQHYNGISWRRGGDILESKGAEGKGQAFGTQNASQVGRSYTTGNRASELQYNGFSWYHVNEPLNNPGGRGSGGSQNAAVYWGGGAPSGPWYVNEWNGTNHYEVSEKSSGREGSPGGGTQNAAVAAGGQANANACRNLTELYDGTTWSNGPSHPMAIQSNNGSGGGHQNEFAIIGSSYPDGYKCHLAFDGVTWGANPLRPTNRCGAGYAGQDVSGLAISGVDHPSSPAATSDVYEFHGAFASGSYLLTNKIGSNYS